MEKIVDGFWRFLERFRNEIILLVLALGWLFLLAVSLQLKPELSFIGDDWSYLEAASTLYFEFLPDETRPLGIAAIYGLPLLFTDNLDHAISWGLTLNLLCWLVSVFVVRWIVIARCGNEFRGIFYAFAALLCVANLAIAFRFLPEPIVILLLLVAVLFLSRFEQSGALNDLSVALAVLLFMVLIQPVVMGIVAIVSMYHFRSLKKLLVHQRSWLVYLMLALVSVQVMAKNTLSHGRPQTATGDVSGSLQYTNAHPVAAYFGRLYENASEGSVIVGETFNAEHTLVFGPAQFFFKTLSKLQNVLLTLIGVVLSVHIGLKRRKMPGFLKVTAAVTLYIVLISGLSCFETTRFHLVCFPIVILMVSEFRAQKKAGVEPA